MSKIIVTGEYSQTLHFGTRDTDALTNLIDQHIEGVHIFQDGDSWEEWGEPLSDSPAGEPEHVQVRGLSFTDALMLTALVSDALVYMTMPHQRGYLSLWTDSEDWSEVHGFVRVEA